MDAAGGGPPVEALIIDEACSLPEADSALPSGGNLWSGHMETALNAACAECIALHACQTLRVETIQPSWLYLVGISILKQRESRSAYLGQPAWHGKTSNRPGSRARAHRDDILSPWR